MGNFDQFDAAAIKPTGNFAQFDAAAQAPQAAPAPAARPPTADEAAAHSAYMQNQADQDWNNGGLAGKATAIGIKGMEWLKNNVSRDSTVGKLGHEVASGALSLPGVPSSDIANYENVRSPQLIDQVEGPPQLGKALLNDSPTGSAVRAVKRNTLPAVGAAVVGSAASTAATPVVGIPAAIATGAGISKLQNYIFPPTEMDQLQAQYDELHHKAAVIGGEVAPALVTGRPTFTRAAASMGQRAVGATVGATVPAAMDLYNGQPIDTARVLTGAAQGALLTPNKLGAALDSRFANSPLNKDYRTYTGGNNQARAQIDAAIPAADKPAAIAAINQGAALNSGGVRPLTGDLIGTPGAEALQGSVARSDPAGTVGKQDLANRTAIAANVSSTLAPTLAPGHAQADAPGKFFAQDQAAQKTSADSNVAKADAALKTGQGELGAEEATIAANKGTQNGASERLHSTLKEDLAAKTSEKNARYDLGAEGAQPVADMAPLHQAARDAVTKGGAFDNTPAVVKSYVGDTVDNLLEHAKTGGPVTYNDAAQLRPILSSALKKAVAANESAPVIEKLTNLQNAVGQVVGQTTAGTAGNEYFKTEFAPKYREGEGGKFAQTVKQGKDVPSDTASRFLKPDSASASNENAAQLQKILATSGSPAKGNQAARDYLVGAMADEVTNPNGQVNPQKLSGWMQKNTEALKQFPQVQSEVAQMSNRINSKSSKVGQLETDLKAATTSKGQLESDLKSNPGTPFIESQPTDAVAKILNGKSPLKDMQAATAEAAKDKTGAATEGLKNAVKEHLNTAVRLGKDLSTSNTPEAADPNTLAVSHDKLNKILSDPGQRAAIEHAFADEPGAVKALDMANKQLQITARKDNSKYGAGPGTSGDVAADSRTIHNGVDLVKSLTGVEGHAPGYIGKGWELIKAAYKGNTKAAAQELTLKTMTDPSFAKVMLQPINKDTFPTFQKTIMGLRTGPYNQPKKEPDKEQK